MIIVPTEKQLDWRHAPVVLCASLASKDPRARRQGAPRVGTPIVKSQQLFPIPLFSVLLAVAQMHEQQSQRC